MSERQPDERLIERLGFPPPPHRIAGSRGPVALFFAKLIVGFLMLIAIALPVSVLGFTSEGKAILTDSALSLGLGSPAPHVRVSLRECDYYRTTGRYGTSGWDCLFDLDDGEAVRAHAVELDSEAEAKRQQGAGVVFGKLGLYWPAGVMFGRWMDYVLAFMISAGLLWVCRFVVKMAPGAAALSRARHGRIRTVDLLTRGGNGWFAFLDDDGVRRFQQSGNGHIPLHLDALLTTGVAVVAGQNAVLLDNALWPFKLPEEQRKAILAGVDEIFRAGMVRTILPPQPGDPGTSLGRIEKIEVELAGCDDPAVLARLYNEAWRLTWDNADAGLSGRIFDARDAISMRLGPEAAWAALRQSREQFVPLPA